MTCSYHIKVGRYSVVAAEDYKPELLNMIIEMTQRASSERNSNGPLGGRGFICRSELPGVGPVVMKRYTHGGIGYKLSKCHYLRLGVLRPQIEFNLLRQAREVGVNVPKPIAYITQGHFLYKAWLLMEEIENEQTLASLSLTDEARARQIMLQVGEQVTKMIQNRICHVDLHPGNVIVSPDNKAYIIDFDKAFFFKKSLHQLRDYYICRWRRAVIKHHLPEYLSELLCAELLKIYNVTRI